MVSVLSAMDIEVDEELTRIVNAEMWFIISYPGKRPARCTIRDIHDACTNLYPDAYDELESHIKAVGNYATTGYYHRTLCIPAVSRGRHKEPRYIWVEIWRDALACRTNGKSTITAYTGEPIQHTPTLEMLQEEWYARE